MRGGRRFSQAISEGDGISVLVEVTDAEAARDAEGAGAEGLVVRRAVTGLRDATELPILWAVDGPPEDAAEAGADACVVVVERHPDDEELAELHRRARDAGLDCAVVVASDEEIAQALELLDAEIFYLAPRREDSLDDVLDLLHDVPAGKHALTTLAAPSRDAVAELERAGMDAVVVDGTTAVAELVHAEPPEV